MECNEVVLATFGSSRLACLLHVASTGVGSFAAEMACVYIYTFSDGA